MSLSRRLVVALFSLAAAATAQAADTSAFSVLVNNSAGKPIMFQSTAALKKGDVINIRAFNAAPVMVLQIAMCDSDCSHRHLVQTVPLTPYFIGAANMNQNFVVPENGHVSFWVQQLGGEFSTPIRARTGTWSVAFVDPFLTVATPQLYPDTRPLPFSALRLNDNTLRARFYHRTFVTIRLADANG
jgi:hypothetical protein